MGGGQRQGFGERGTQPAHCQRPTGCSAGRWGCAGWGPRLRHHACIPESRLAYLRGWAGRSLRRGCRLPRRGGPSRAGLLRKDPRLGLEEKRGEKVTAILIILPPPLHRDPTNPPPQPPVHAFLRALSDAVADGVTYQGTSECRWDKFGCSLMHRHKVITTNSRQDVQF